MKYLPLLLLLTCCLPNVRVYKYAVIKQVDTISGQYCITCKLPDQKMMQSWQYDIDFVPGDTVKVNVISTIDRYEVRLRKCKN